MCRRIAKQVCTCNDDEQSGGSASESFPTRQMPSAAVANSNLATTRVGGACQVADRQHAWYLLAHPAVFGSLPTSTGPRMSMVRHALRFNLVSTHSECSEYSIFTMSCHSPTP